MNYRHIYHAGNFADVFKHLILTMVIDYMQNKEKGFFILDAFAGCGLYDLKSQKAERTLEYQSGIANFMDMNFDNLDLQKFQSLIAPYWKLNLYPGSPLLIAEKLRPQDRLFANELHPDDFQELRQTLKGFANTKALHLDAYESIRANAPPAERRGLILIDPPFERKDEFEVLADQMHEWARKWATGCYMIWYPIKAGSNSHVMFEAAQELTVNRIWVSEFLLHPRNTPNSFNGCGVLILNTPFQIPERVEALSSILCLAMGGIEITSHYLRAD